MEFSDVQKQCLSDKAASSMIDSSRRIACFNWREFAIFFRVGDVIVRDCDTGTTQVYGHSKSPCSAMMMILCKIIMIPCLYSDLF